MAKRGASDEDRLLERLREAVSGDQGTRRLKRRYDALRRDYETLLDRLADIEQRIELQDYIAAEEPEPPPPVAPRPAPQHTAGEATAPPRVTGRLTESLMVPLFELREEYLAAATSINTIVGGLESLAAGAMKGQHATPAASERPTPVRDDDAPPRQQSVQVDVRGEGFGNLLDFQERLSGIEGVSRVSINAIDNDRATLVVELEDGA